METIDNAKKQQKTTTKNKKKQTQSGVKMWKPRVTPSMAFLAVNFG